MNTHIEQFIIIIIIVCFYDDSFHFTLFNSVQLVK